MNLDLFWFEVAVICGVLDLYFINIALVIVAAACFLTGLVSFFFSSIYLQIAVLILCAGLMLFVLKMTMTVDRYESSQSDYLKRLIGRPVVVHEWRQNRYAEIQLNGKIWKSEIAFNDDSTLRPGTYRIWKVLPSKIILMK